jgi:hypothetical protein
VKTFLDRDTQYLQLRIRGSPDIGIRKARISGGMAFASWISARVEGNPSK